MYPSRHETKTILWNSKQNIFFSYIHRLVWTALFQCIMENTSTITVIICIYEFLTQNVYLSKYYLLLFFQFERIFRILLSILQTIFDSIRINFYLKEDELYSLILHVWFNKRTTKTWNRPQIDFLLTNCFFAFSLVFLV